MHSEVINYDINLYSVLAYAGAAIMDIHYKSAGHYSDYSFPHVSECHIFPACWIPSGLKVLSFFRHFNFLITCQVMTLNCFSFLISLAVHLGDVHVFLTSATQPPPWTPQQSTNYCVYFNSILTSFKEKIQAFSHNTHTDHSSCICALPQFTVTVSRFFIVKECPLNPEGLLFKVIAEGIM